MTPLATGVRKLRLRDRRQQVADVLVGALAVVMLVSAAALDRPATFVDRIEIANPTSYQVEVEVRGAASQGWLALGGFRRESSRTVEDVLDQGDRWTFRFSYGGFVAGEVGMSRADVRGQVMIPPSVGDRLAEAGFAPSAF